MTKNNKDFDLEIECVLNGDFLKVLDGISVLTNEDEGFIDFLLDLKKDSDSKVS